MDKLGTLRANIRRYEKLCVAFSGGVDSTLLLKAAVDEIGAENCLAVIADGIMLPRRELAEAISLAEEIGARYEVINIDALAVPEFAANERMRCYFCKKNIFGMIQARAAEEGMPLADGMNADDVKIFRPGQQAARELGVVSPLAEADMTKAEVREASKTLSLPTWDKPAKACLATRLPYDTPVTAERLRVIEQAEDILRDMELINVRVRLHGDIARIETDRENFGVLIASDAPQKIKALGACAKYITLDLEGFRSGSMD